MYIDDGMNAVAVAVSRMLSIETIKLNGNGFSSDGMKSLTEVLKLNSTIKCLEVVITYSNLCLSYFFILKCFIFCYLSYIFSSQSIFVVDISQVCSNRIGDDGAELLADMIKGHCSILDIRADSNLIGNFNSIYIFMSPGDFINFVVGCFTFCLPCRKSWCKCDWGSFIQK